MAAGILDDATAVSGEVAELRHAIHAEPEIGLDLPKTQRKVLDALDGLPLEISTVRDSVLSPRSCAALVPARRSCSAGTWTRCR